MMHIPKPNETEFENPPAGAFLAVCYRVIDLGTQSGSYMGQPKSAHKVLLSWELPEELMRDGRPFTISQRYTWSMSEKATLRKHLEAWRGVPFADADFGTFDIQKVIGAGCILNIVHANKDGKTYANIASISRMMKGMTAPPARNEQAYLWLHDDRWSAAVFHSLSQNLQGVIMQAPEYRTLMNGDGRDEPPPADADSYNGPSFHDDPIPFAPEFR